MVVHDRHHVGAGSVDSTMNEALGIGLAGFMADDLALVREFHDVADFDAIWSARPRQQEMVGIGGMAHRHMAEGIHNVMIGQNAIGGDEIVLDLTDVQHEFLPGALHAS